LSTKAHATCDVLGNPTGFSLSEGPAHDLDGADALLPEFIPKIKALLADKAYDAHERVIAPLEKADVQIVIPPEANRSQKRGYDEEMYKWRHLIDGLARTQWHRLLKKFGCSERRRLNEKGVSNG
jgi:hypothetical protein